MKGTNILLLNKTETKRALEYYLNNIQFKEPIKVSDIKEKHNDSIFEISIIDIEEKT